MGPAEALEAAAAYWRAGAGRQPSLPLSDDRAERRLPGDPSVATVPGPGGGWVGGGTAEELLDRAADEKARSEARGIRIATLADDDYPALLHEIPDPPPVLYIWGDLEPDDEVRVAIVGSRRASRYGLTVAEGLARELGRRGIVIVSGLARGIDAAAHRGALAAPARTIAVLGSGLEVIYPREHTELAGKIAAAGAVISEYPLKLGPFPQLFPRRNRVISGLSAGVVIVEAARASGALVTARLALEQGRELYAVPGSILSETSAGANGLLREGVAHMVTRSEDLLAELPAVFRMRLGLPASPLDEPLPPPERVEVRPDQEREPGDGSAGATSDEALVVRHLSHDSPVSIDDLLSMSGLPVARLLAALSTLELRGLTVTLPGNRVCLGRVPAV